MTRHGLINETGNVLGSIADFATDFVHPTIRLGVTGLSRAGKTVFITALVHNLLNSTRLALFNASAGGRISRCYLEPQPNDQLPRFAYEDHLAALSGENRDWPQSTRRLSELRLTIDYAAQSFFARNIRGGRLHIDIVDYPGEWLLDLPLLAQSYAEWSRATLRASQSTPRRELANAWLSHLAALDPAAPAEESHARTAAELFTAYLASGRADAVSLSTLPPGRFLMPGDLAGSPLLTFAPLEVQAGASPPKGSLWAMMQRRYDAYVGHVVKPFFFDHFARLDRQIVLVDALSALNAGPAAVADLKAALEEVLSCFRQGGQSWLSSIFSRRIDRILFAATKADLVHHTSHDRLEAVMRLLVDDAANRAEYAGAEINVSALAAIRATREATVKHDGEKLPCIAGIPEAGQSIGREVFDGLREAAVFPGDLPENPEAALDGSLEDALRFVRFRPPVRSQAIALQPESGFPHIRLDRAIEFLIGDAFP